MLDKDRVVGVCRFIPARMGMSVEDAGVDHRQRVEDRDVSARRLFQRLGRGVDLRERARCAFDGAGDGLDVRMLLGGGQNGGGVVLKCLFQYGILGGSDDGIEIGP